MSDPPVDPRTESSPGPGAQRPRPRSFMRSSEPPDDSRGMPTVQVPIGRPSATAPQWSIPQAPLSTPPVQPQDYPPADAYPADPAFGSGPFLYPDPAEAFVGRVRPRVRKVSRVVRAVDAWSVFKVSLIFYLAMYAVCLIAGVLLWNVAYSTGTVDNISSFFESFGWKSFEFKGGEIFHNAWIIGLFLVVGLTGLNVVMATLFNLITDLVGGLRFTVLEEEVVVRRTDPAAADAEGMTSPVLAGRPTLDRWRRRARRS